MSHPLLGEVFTLDELSRAAGLTRRHVDALVASGQVRFIDGTPYISGAEALRIGGRMRGPSPAPRPSDLFAAGEALERRAGLPAIASSAVHAIVVTALLALTTLDAGTTATEEPAHEPARLVFLVTPGPGGGGGGGGLRNPLPPQKVERRGPERTRTAVPPVTLRPAMTVARNVEPPTRPSPPPPLRPEPADTRAHEPEPLSSRVLVAPVVSSAAGMQDKAGVVEGGAATDSQGSGTGGGAGTGRGTGSGEGDGAGIGPGSGGGIGGGPYRPGSGIEPPRLLREVKAEYTEDARRRGISGDVILEIVVRRDGSVGDVRLLQGLGAGLDAKAIGAVRQWRFDPARRRGAPVDVLVEVAVEFTLR